MPTFLTKREEKNKGFKWEAGEKLQWSSKEKEKH
jgi:hypothetical protein